MLALTCHALPWQSAKCNELITIPFTWNKSPKISETSFFGYAFVKWMLELGYLYAVFPLRARPHLAKHELPHPPPPMQLRWTVTLCTCKMMCYKFIVWLLTKQRIVTEIWRPWGHKCGVPGVYLFSNLSINYIPIYNYSCLNLRRQQKHIFLMMEPDKCQVWDETPNSKDQDVIIHWHISRSNDREVCSIHEWWSARGKMCSSTNSSTRYVSWIIPQMNKLWEAII